MKISTLIEIPSDTTVQVRFTLTSPVGKAHHRTMFTRDGASIAEQMAAVNANLKQMQWPEVGADEIARIQRIADAAWGAQA